MITNPNLSCLVPPQFEVTAAIILQPKPSGQQLQKVFLAAIEQARFFEPLPTTAKVMKMPLVFKSKFIVTVKKKILHVHNGKK